VFSASIVDPRRDFARIFLRRFEISHLGPTYRFVPYLLLRGRFKEGIWAARLFFADSSVAAIYAVQFVSPLGIPQGLQTAELKLCNQTRLNWIGRPSIPVLNLLARDVHVFRGRRLEGTSVLQARASAFVESVFRGIL